ncbi:hypothetical protein ACFBZI_08725 [Moraxella sp. ZJ142]|uniref:hypothetical protein n=1 Tax=Moraxella marmotae TaxID=3344520 RepID=UPI0035D46CF3
MSAGIKIYNHNQQVSINSNDLMFCLAIKDTIQSPKGRPQINTTLAVSNYIDASRGYSGLRMPLLVHEIGGWDKRIQLTNYQKKDGIVKIAFWTPEEMPVNVFFFDLSSNFTAPSGGAGLKMYTQNGELSFDSRMKHLKIIGVANDGMSLEPNKKYGILVRSLPDTVEEEQWSQDKRKIYHTQIYKRKLFWIENNTLRASMIETGREENWYWRSTGRPYSNGGTGKKEMVPPLLVDITDL